MFEKHDIDFRNFRLSNTIHISGDADLAGQCFTALQRPRPEVVDRFSILQNSRKRITYIPRHDIDEANDLLASCTIDRPIIFGGLNRYWQDIGMSGDEIAEKYKDNKFPEYDDISFGKIHRKIICESDAFNYTSGINLPSDLIENFRLPFPLGYDLIHPQLWMGTTISNKLASTKLHRDTTDGFLGQVVGRKK